ncbi:hypothetical protein GF382_00455 [Candidatus Falkowbacteria bacterium]|nr:hypothetical protein [Candidatus Falkowbacteria bacterium]
MKENVKKAIARAKDGSIKLKNNLERAFKVKDARDRKIFYSILATIILILVYIIFIRGYISRQDEKKEAQEKARVEKIRQERVEKIEKAPKSRISFFLSKPIRASLAMPDYWEGNYRISEKDNTASFIYIEDAERTTPIFHIKMVSLGELSNLEKGEKEIDKNKRVKREDETYTFVYKIYDQHPYEEDSDLGIKFERMTIDCQEMINKYFKTF